MKVQRIDNMFHFTFQKTTQDIRDAAKAKAVAIGKKIGEREQRITKIRADYKITDKNIIEMLQRARAAASSGNLLANYSTSVQHDDGHVEEVTVGAGVINNILTEQDFIEGEKSQVEHLEMIVNNLDDVQHVDGGQIVVQKKHSLSYAELKFLGF